LEFLEIPYLFQIFDLLDRGSLTLNNKDIIDNKEEIKKNTIKEEKNTKKS